MRRSYFLLSGHAPKSAPLLLQVLNGDLAAGFALHEKDVDLAA